MPDPWDTLKLLSDSTRLRLVALLQTDELSVAELQEILDMGQSRISSHLALLRQGGLVTDRRQGKKTFYSLNADLSASNRELTRSACHSVGEHPQLREDRKILERILERRQRFAEEYFNSLAGRLGKNYCPGRSWEAFGHFLLKTTPPIEIADLGAGEGLISQLLAQRAKQVYCIDKSRRMVEVGKELARKNRLSNLEYLLGDIESVPLPDRSVDLALLSQALHHARHPETAVREACRILRPGGQIVILDLKEHDFEKARELYADLWLGFPENTLYSFLREAGFKNIEVGVVSREKHEPHFETILASGVKGGT